MSATYFHKIKPILLSFMFICLLASSTANAEFSGLSVPAKLKMELSIPGTNEHFLRPARIFVDKPRQEVYIIDQGNNRIVIFDSNGIMEFEFAGMGPYGTPLDVAVNSDGFIYVLASIASGQCIAVHDFDGKVRDIFDENRIPNFLQTEVELSSISIDNNDNLYLLDNLGPRIFVFSGNMEYIREIPIITDMDEKMREETILGSILVNGERIYIPAASLGMVYVYDIMGKFIRCIGYSGGNIGEFGFPIGVAVTVDGIVAVLDKHRFNIVCFTTDGKFLGEFGGKGFNPGWFYHPTWIAAEKNLIYVGQMFQNRVQVCEIPEFIMLENSKQIGTKQQIGGDFQERGSAHSERGGG